MWQHIYHMLHSLDMWFINPNIYTEPNIHKNDLNNLDVKPSSHLSRCEINDYYNSINNKITSYLKSLKDDELLLSPKNCIYNKFTLIIAQYRHLHTHMGMIMGFIIDDTGMWPRVLGLENPIPDGENYTKFF